MMDSISRWLLHNGFALTRSNYLDLYCTRVFEGDTAPDPAEVEVEVPAYISNQQEKS